MTFTTTRYFANIIVLSASLIGCGDSSSDGSEWTGTATVTTGVGQTVETCAAIVDCPNTPPSGASHVTSCGEITSEDELVWSLPAPISDGEVAVNIFETCYGAGENADFESELVTKVIDEEGEEITGYLFANNYFELYVNGEFVARDEIAFVPFNSTAVRFQAEYPITYAVELVDWEDYLGIGLEAKDGYRVGDAGFIAALSDGTATNAEWRCRAFYIAPLDDEACIQEDANGNPDSSGCPSSEDDLQCVANDPENTCKAAHYPLPENWMSPDFDDSDWPVASLYEAADVTDNMAYVKYADTLFADSEFIWTQNNNLDNHIVCRITVQAP